MQNDNLCLKKIPLICSNSSPRELQVSAHSNRAHYKMHVSSTKHIQPTKERSHICTIFKDYGKELWETVRYFQSSQGVFQSCTNVRSLKFREISVQIIEIQPSKMKLVLVNRRNACNRKITKKNKSVAIALWTLQRIFAESLTNQLTATKSQVEFLIKINRVIFWVQVLEPLKSIKSKWERSISIITCILSLW